MLVHAPMDQKKKKKKKEVACDCLYARMHVQLKQGKRNQMEAMIKEGVALLEPQLLTAVGVLLTVYVGHFVSWLN